MKPTDLAALRIPSGPSVSPDGRVVAVAVTRVDLDADEYRSRLWLVPADGSARPRPFTHGHRDEAPKWSPDGRWLAFRRGDRDEPCQLYVMPADGGEPRRVTDAPLGVREFAWAPDATRIAYVAQVPEPGRYERGEGARPAGKEAPRRITRLRYRYDSEGFVFDRPRHVFVVDALADDATPVQLTRTDWQFERPSWTPDGRHVVFSSARHDLEGTLAGDVFVASTDGGELRQVTRSTTTVGSPVVAPDGATVYFLGTDRLDLAGRTVGLFAVPFDGSEEPRRLTDAEDWDFHDAHHDSPLVATADRLLALAARRGAVELVAVPYGDEKPELVTEGSHLLTGVAAAGGTVAVVETTDVSAGEVAIVSDAGLRVVSDFGEEFARTVALRPMRELTATAPDGYDVHGWVVKPAGQGPHPVLLVIHGGPFTQYGYTLFDEAQVYAAAGYAVVLGNPRGANGYGEAHGRAIVGDWGNKDRVDLITLLDAALADPDLDAGRVGVMGGSYGGFMTTWLAAHDGERFRAALSERALNTWDSFTGASDIGWFFTEANAGTDPERVAAQSPLGYVDRIDIPVLVVHSEQDWRCPVDQGQRLFVALKQRGVRTELLLFPGEGHELSRSGLPSHRVARFEAVLDWWREHLGVDA